MDIHVNAVSKQNTQTCADNNALMSPMQPTGICGTIKRN